MRVRATLRLRNDSMIVARERLGLSQKALAELAGVPVYDVAFFESFRYADIGNDGRAPKIQKAQRIAEVLEIPAVMVMRDEDAEVAVDSTRVAVAEVELLQLPSMPACLMLAPPADEDAQTHEAAAIVREQLDRLRVTHPRHAECLAMRFGIGYDRPMTLEEVGGKLGIGIERVRQLEGRAIRFLQHPIRAKAMEAAR